MCVKTLQQVSTTATTGVRCSAMQPTRNCILGFKATEKDLYTVSFDYDGGETLYLIDLISKISTRINNQNEYMFSQPKGDMPARFIISRTPTDEVATGIDGNPHDSRQTGIVRKVLINGVIYIIRGNNIYDVTGIRIR